MNPQFPIKAAITVALVLAASLLSKRPGLLGALVAAMSMDIFWFVLGGLLFFPVLSFSLKAGWHPWLCFALAGIAAFAGMSGAQFLLAHWRPR